MVGGKSAALFANDHFSQTWNPRLIGNFLVSIRRENRHLALHENPRRDWNPSHGLSQCQRRRVFFEAVKELNARGQEIAGHFYTQDSILPYLSPEEEREVIQRCSRIIEKAVGTRLTGWFSPVAAPTVHTAEFLAEAGFLWHGDYNDTDLPYVFTTPKGVLVAIRTVISRTTVCYAAARGISTMSTKTPSISSTNTKARLCSI